MIFVAVGTQKFQFNRLLRALDELVDNQMLKTEVFAQIGHSDYIPQSYSHKDFLNRDEFDEFIKRCDVLITHSGVATIMTGLKYNKAVIVVPRLAKFGEHVDDHQIQIAETFCEKGYIMMCNDKGDILKAIKKSENYQFSEYKSGRDLVIKTIREYIHNYENQR